LLLVAVAPVVLEAAIEDQMEETHQRLVLLRQAAVAEAVEQAVELIEMPIAEVQEAEEARTLEPVRVEQE
jgi:hypothetical protein